MNPIYRIILLGLLVTGGISGYSQNSDSDVIWKKSKGKYSLCHADGNPLSSATYDSYGEWKGDLTWISDGNKFGCINKQGKEMIPPMYENIGINFSDQGVVIQQDGKWGFISWNNEIIIPAQYDLCTDPYPSGIIGVKKGGEKVNKKIIGGKWGFISAQGEILIPPKYDFIGSYGQDGLIWVNLGGEDKEGRIIGGKFGLIDSTGREVLPLAYDGDASARKAYRESKEKVYWKQTGNKFALYDKKTNKPISKNYDKHWDWLKDKAGVSRDQKFGYINKNGKEIIPAIYDDITLKYSDRGTFVRKDGKWGFIDWQGKNLIPFQYDIMGTTHDNGLIPFNIGGQTVTGSSTVSGGKWGYLNLDGQTITPVKYDYTGSNWIDGLVWVNQGGSIDIRNSSVSGGKFGLIDSTGTEVAPLLFSGEKNAREALRKGLSNQFGIQEVIPEVIWNY